MGAGDGFRPHGPVSWSDPRVLVRAGIAAAASTYLRGFSDRRTAEAALCPPSQCWAPDRDAEPVPAEGAYWFDFVADVGDGFDATFAIAWSLARPHRPAGEDLPRGELLVLGGDEVYPLPDRDGYLDRTLQPYALAEHGAPPHRGRAVALPGNHDWYDGLDAFTEQFRPGHRLGSRDIAQRHSYFARRLPYGWWLLGADTNLDGRLDTAQRDFFADVVAPKIGPDDSVVLCLPQPVWVTGPMHYDTGPTELGVMRFFRQRVCRNGQLRLFLSGDLHHYHRYADETAEPVQYVTAGGGGAYLVGTHHLPEHLDLTPSYQRTRRLRPDSVPPGIPAGADRARLRQTYPDRRTSRRLSGQVLWRMYTNWPFGVFLALVYGLAVLIEGHALRAAQSFRPGLAEVLAAVSPVCPAAPCPDAYGAAHFAGALVRSPGVWLLVAVLLALCWSLPTHLPWLKRAALAGALAVGHATAFFVAQVVFHALLVRSAVLGPGDPVLVPAVAGWVMLAGYVGGLTVCAWYLLVASWFGANHNELFAAMRLATHKCFLRLRVAPNGTLTVFPLKVERPPRVRRPGRRLAAGALRDYRVAPQLIEEPVTVRPRGSLGRPA